MPNPRASKPRGFKAARPRTGPTPTPQVRHFASVPRAMFIGLLRKTPGGMTFQAPSPFSSSRGPSAYPPLKGLTEAWAVGHRGDLAVLSP